MRTQLIESVLIGIVISGIVLAARWFVPEQPAIQLVLLLIGAGMLVALQRLLIQLNRRHISPASIESPTEPQTPATVPTTALHSPRLGWVGDSEPEIPSATQTTPITPTRTTESEQTNDNNSEKVV